VGDKCRNQPQPAHGELASLIADDRFRLSGEDEDDLLGAVRVHPGVLAGLELEVDDGGARGARDARDREIDADPTRLIRLRRDIDEVPLSSRDGRRAAEREGA
jgi:hypothetical protein